MRAPLVSDYSKPNRYGLTGTVGLDEDQRLEFIASAEQFSARRKPSAAAVGRFRRTWTPARFGEAGKRTRWLRGVDWYRWRLLGSHKSPASFSLPHRASAAKLCCATALLAVACSGELSGGWRRGRRLRWCALEWLGGLGYIEGFERQSDMGKLRPGRRHSELRHGKGLGRCGVSWRSSRAG